MFLIDCLQFLANTAIINRRIRTSDITKQRTNLRRYPAQIRCIVRLTLTVGHRAVKVSQIPTHSRVHVVHILACGAVVALTRKRTVGISTEELVYKPVIGNVVGVGIHHRFRVEVCLQLTERRNVGIVPKVFRSDNFDVGVFCKQLIVFKLRIKGIACGKPSVLIDFIRPKIYLNARTPRHGKPCFYVEPVRVPSGVAAAAHPCVCRRVLSFVHCFVVVRTDGRKHQIGVGVKLLTCRIRIVVIRRRLRQVCVVCKVSNLDRRSRKTVCFVVYVCKQVV